uniref:asparagine synthase (glutamine-hydrolyzing) n=1 Tax=viral metagenome TaxID=1070528 RepID=A0A6C0HYB5_9ZZZZ
MCGIFAFLNSDSDDDMNKIKKEFKKGEGRGPESHTLTEVGKNVIIGFHRLAINGLNPESDQPFQQDNLTLICNGEIYNYKELYKILGIEPKTQSDCEVILHLYRRFGIEQTLQLLDGVFAFILIDYNIYEDSAKLYAARDPFGIRPLYIMQDSKRIGFASEIKCLANLRLVNKSTSIAHFTPGTYATFEMPFLVNSQWKLAKTDQRYHIPSVIYSVSTLPTESIINKNITEALVNAVEKRCVTTERPIACLLSGGLDSSLITALVNDYHKKNALPQLETYSIGLEGSVDLHYARIVADYLGTKHTEILLTEQDFTAAIPEVIYAIESYDTTTVRASIGNYLLGKYIREHSLAKVIFNGDGSDELTGGYLYFHKSPNEIEFDLECRRLLRDIHMFDVLRSDKCISTHGLEPRTPFLDRGWVQTYLSIHASVRCHTLTKKCEKYLLRSAFSQYKNWEGNAILPEEILWRTKEAFSDGVSMNSRSLYQIIQEYVEVEKLACIDTSVRYLHNPPKTAEQHYYRAIFERHYAELGGLVPYMWMPRFVEGATDASARTLQIYDEIAEKK